MALRRSARIAEQKKQKNNQPIVAIVQPPKPRRSQQLREQENEELKKQVKKMKKTMTTTLNLLVAEQRNVEILGRQVLTVDDEIGIQNQMYRELREQEGRNTTVLENQLKEIAKIQGKAQECKDHGNEKDVVEKEKRNTERYRDGLLAEVKEGGLFPWKVCEQCVMPYGGEVGRIPRVLCCGHTFCTDCVQSFKNETSKTICCPVDRQFMSIGEEGVSEVPKNYVLLNM